MEELKITTVLDASCIMTHEIRIVVSLNRIISLGISQSISDGVSLFFTIAVKILKHRYRSKDE